MRNELNGRKILEDLSLGEVIPLPFRLLRDQFNIPVIDRPVCGRRELGLERIRKFVLFHARFIRDRVNYACGGVNGSGLGPSDHVPDLLMMQLLHDIIKERILCAVHSPFEGLPRA